MEHHITGFAREAEDEVGSAVETVGVDELNGFACGGEGVATVDAGESGIVNGLNTEFYYDGGNGFNGSNGQ